MPGRIRRAVEAAMAETMETADKFEKLADLALAIVGEITDRGGIDLTFKSIMGIKIPATTIQVRIAPQVESEE